MTDKLSSCETDHIKPAIPVIQVNGEGVEADEATEGCSALCSQVITVCDSGRTLEEGLQAYREHQQTKVNELQELMEDFSLMDCD